MKKLFAILAVITIMMGSTATVFAQEEVVETAATEQIVPDNSGEEMVSLAVAPEDMPEGEPMHYVLKQQFLDGGAGWMTPILLCLIIGLAIVIERVIYLNLATTNTKKLLDQVEEALRTGGVEAAKEVCRNTRGPVASIFYQGLSRMNEGVDVVEKTVVSYGSVQMGQLESGLTWIALFIAIAPMLGFMGTVVGMIQAFDAIALAGDISPTLVASGIKVALLTTVGGLIVAVILQVFYNYLLSKVDSLVMSMEDASISLIDIVSNYNKR